MALHPRMIPDNAPSRVYAMSAFRPPTRPPMTYYEYADGLKLIPYRVHNAHYARTAEDGTIIMRGSPSTLLEISNVLQNLPWDENTQLKIGGGIIGIGASKVTIYVSKQSCFALQVFCIRANCLLAQ